MDIEIEKINFEGDILKVIKATVTEMRGINNNQKYDFDLYQIEARSPMSTREITLTVDFIEKKVSGDIIAFGDEHNDLEMLDYAGWGVAMANGTQQLKSIANDVTDKTNAEDGMVDYLEKYLGL